MERELTNKQIDIINNTLLGSPVSSGALLVCFKIGSEVMFNNSILTNQTINTLAIISGNQLYYDVVRRDGSEIDVDRRLMSVDRNSASGAFIQSIPMKNFPEHHNAPSFYLN